MYLVYSCGSNGRYQLGYGTDEDLDSLKLVFEAEVRPVKIVCGGNHTLLLLENGDLFAAGDDTYGQCGINSEDLEDKSIKTFTLVPQVNGFKWIDCSAGYEFSIFLNDNQDLFAAGLGPKGELGISENVKQSNTLTRLSTNFSSNISQIKSCLDHTLVLLENHDIYGWGNGRNGKLGEPVEPQIWRPRKFDIDVNATHVEVGRDYSAIGDLEGNFKILGKDKFHISLQASKSWKDFKSMWSSVHFINESGEIISVGNGSHGQLVPNKDIDYTLFEVGSEHAIIADGQLIKSWGWGEHGNCGINKTDSVTFDYINDLHEFTNDETIIMIKGGCATTWAITQRN